MTVRKTIFWLHLSVGAAAGVIILLMSVTGVLLTYELQITDWANRSHWQIQPTSDARRLPLARLLDAAKVEKATPTSIAVASDLASPVTIGMGRGRSIAVNPYTGAVLGEGATGTKAFFRGVTDLHRWLALGGASRSTGRAITGACNLGFLFLVVSGIYLWWPRKWSRAGLKNIVLLQPRLRGKARDWNWHHAIGLWCWLPLLVIVASGVVISYPWAGNLLYRAVGETPPAPGARTAAPAAKPRSQHADAAGVLNGVDEALLAAQRFAPDWRTVALALPQSAESPLVLTIDQGTGRQPQKKSQLTLSRAGETVRWEPFSSQSARRRLRSLARFGHTGEAGGLFGQSIAGLASAGAVVLVWTGISLSLRRWAASRRRRAAARATVAEPPVHLPASMNQ